MKITIAYLPEQEKKTAAIVATVLHLFPGAKVHESDRHAPFHHIYITTRKPETPCGTKENA